MTSPLDERAHAAAIEAMVSAAIGTEENGDARVYDYGKVPGADGNDGVLPRIYALVSIERRAGVTNLKVGRTSRSGWRLTIRYVGHTTNEARWAGLQIAVAVNEKQITIGSTEPSTPITHESTTAVAPDGGLYSGLVQYTYAL